MERSTTLAKIKSFYFLFLYTIIFRFTRAGGLPPIFQAGEVVLLSSEKELALSQGSVVSVDTEDIIVLLDRDIRFKFYIQGVSKNLSVDTIVSY